MLNSEKNRSKVKVVVQVQEDDFTICPDCGGWRYSPSLHKMICVPRALP